MGQSRHERTRILFVANRAEFFLSHRLPIARAARGKGYEVHVATPPSPEVEDIEARGYRWHALELEGKSLNPFQELRTLFHLYRLYREVQPDLVHHVAFKAVLYGGMAARLARVPRVVNAFTGLGFMFSADTLKVRLLRRVILQLCRLSLGHPHSCTIFQNPDNIAEFVDRGIIEREKVVLIKGSGVDVGAFTLEPEPDGVPIVMLASRLVWEKGVGEFVEAARRLKEEGVEARFALVGKSDPLNPHAVPEEQLRVWHDQGVIEWWGFQENMPEVFAKVHVVCLPSYYREGVPKVLIEAASAGRPIVTTDMPGCREIVQDGINGHLVPPCDIETLADRLCDVLESPVRRREMGRQGRHIVKEEFSLERVVRDTMKVYDNLLSRGKALESVAVGAA